MPTDARQLHDVDLPGEPRERVRACIMEMQVSNEETFAGLAKECIEAGAGYSPGETLDEWVQKANRVFGQGHFTGTTGQVFRLMRDACDAGEGVYSSAIKGEDLSGSHPRSEADEECQRTLSALCDWALTSGVAQVTDETANFPGCYAAHSWRVLPRSPEADKGVVAAPLPLVPSDGEDVGQDIDVALDAALRHHFKTGVPPFGEIEATYIGKLTEDKFWEVTEKCIDSLRLPSPAALPGADLVPVPLKSLSERLTGYAPTLHGQNFGLSRSCPEARGGFSLEGARLANSVPVDLNPPVSPVPVDVRHGGRRGGIVGDGKGR